MMLIDHFFYSLFLYYFSCKVSKGSGSIGTRSRGFSRVRRYRAQSDPAAPEESVFAKSNSVRVVDIRDHEESKTAVIMILRLPQDAEVEFLFDLISDDPKLIVEEMKADAQLDLTGISASTLLEVISPIAELAKGVAMRIVGAEKAVNDERNKIVGNVIDIDIRDDGKIDKDEPSSQINAPSTSSSSTSSSAVTGSLNSSSSYSTSSMLASSTPISLSERILYEALFMDIYLKDDIEVNGEKGSRFERYRSSSHHFEPLLKIVKAMKHINRGIFV